MRVTSYCLNINNFGGEFYSGEVDEDFWPYDKVIANVKIFLAGNPAQKIICGRGTYGCEEDLGKARSEIYRLVNRTGYKSC